jgi:hypothetical protein
VGPTSAIHTRCEYLDTIRTKETNDLIANPQFGQTVKLGGPIAGLQLCFLMGYTSGDHLRCEYTVSRTPKNAKKGKINPKSDTKLTSQGKNGPKIPETPPVFLALSRLLLISETRTDTCPWQPSHAHLASQSCVLDVMSSANSSPRAEGASPPSP